MGDDVRRVASHNEEIRLTACVVYCTAPMLFPAQVGRAQRTDHSISYKYGADNSSFMSVFKNTQRAFGCSVTLKIDFVLEVYCLPMFSPVFLANERLFPRVDRRVPHQLARLGENLSTIHALVPITLTFAAASTTAAGDLRRPALLSP